MNNNRKSKNETEEILKTKDGSHIACITYEDNLILQKYFAKVKELEQGNNSNKNTNIIKENKEEYKAKKTHNKHTNSIVYWKEEMERTNKLHRYKGKSTRI